MKRIKDIFIILVYFFLLEGLFARPAFAYIDPGTGSYIFQILAASLLTAVVFARSIIRSIRVFIQKLFPRKKPTAHDQN